MSVEFNINKNDLIGCNYVTLKKHVIVNKNNNQNLNSHLLGHERQNNERADNQAKNKGRAD